jgi:hypothetical protein
MFVFKSRRFQVGLARWPPLSRVQPFERTVLELFAARKACRTRRLGTRCLGVPWDAASQALFSFAAICATCRPWKCAPAGSLSLGCRELSAPAIVEPEARFPGDLFGHKFRHTFDESLSPSLPRGRLQRQHSPTSRYGRSSNSRGRERGS